MAGRFRSEERALDAYHDKLIAAKSINGRTIVSHESRICAERVGGLDAFVLNNGLVRLSVVPELGGKITSLIRLESGCEYLLQARDSDRAYRRRSFGDKFEDYEPCGFDECVPTIAECLYPEEPFLARQLPDHGDVWCLPSSVEVSGDEINLTTSLSSLPLRFTKKIKLLENTIRFDYEATNTSQSGVKFLWSAHPLLQIEPGAEIVLTREAKELEVDWSKNDRLGKAGDRCAWPNATERSGRRIAINRVVSANAGTAEKLFTPRLLHGCCGVFQAQENENIFFRFDPMLVPYVGIWICQGGWPASRAFNQFTVALEPCNGRPDSLAEAIGRSECATLGPYGTKQWWMEIEVNGGAPPSLRTSGNHPDV